MPGKRIAGEWIPADEAVPSEDDYILLSFGNYSVPLVGRYEEDEDGGGNFYVGDEDEPCTKHDVFVNAWMYLPEPYTEESESKMTGKEAAALLSAMKVRIEWDYPLDYQLALDKAERALDTIGSLTKQIKSLKSSVKSSNSDYLTGYLCALSAVEGMIAG